MALSTTVPPQISASLVEGLGFLLFTGLTLLFVAVTMVLAQKAGLLKTQDWSDVDTWWGRPIRRGEHEPSGTNPGFLIIMISLIIGMGLSMAIVDALLF